MGNPRCRWVRDRLPLLAGDDLVGPDRRRVESHIVGCPECRRRRLELGRALRALEAASATSPVRPDAPSLWPDLARQIRESRRPHRGPTFDFRFGFSFSPPGVNPWPALGLIMGLLAVVGATAAVRHRIAATHAEMAANARPIAIPMISRDFAERPRDSAPSHDLPTPVAENLPPQRFHDDLDPVAATNTTPDPRDTKPSY